MTGGSWLAVAIGLVALAVVVAVPLRRRVLRTPIGESGWARWRGTAAALPAADRLRVWWANTTGRAVADPRLAPAAAQRGKAAAALARSVGARTRWLYRVLTVVWFGLAVASLLDGRWVMGGVQVLVGIATLAMPAVIRWEAGLSARSAEANRRRAYGE